jgi:hypothetical protein
MSNQQATRTSLALLAVALLAVPATADCGDDPSNLFNAANCDFDSDIAGWTVSGTGATASWSMADGDPEPGSIQGVVGSGGVFNLTSACAQVSGSTLYGMGARLRGISGVGLCFWTFSEYSTSNCSGSPTVLASTSGIPGSTWFNAHLDATTDASSLSVSAVLGCDGQNGATARFDNLYLGQGLTIPVELTAFSVE